MPSRTIIAILTFVVLIMSLRALPGDRWRMQPDLGSVLDFQPRDLPALPPALPKLAPTKYSPHSKAPIVAAGLTAPAGSLDRFYQSLWRTENHVPGAVTRILHYGDSPVTADSITADARSLFHNAFGDAGHGFVLIAKPWAWYGHRGIELKGKGWKIEAASQSRARDGFHGLGGVSFTGSAGAYSEVTLPDRLHTRVEVQYLKEPDGGVFSVEAGETVLGEVHTSSETKEPAFTDFDLPAQTKTVTVRVTAGTTRLFGWQFEKVGPGVEYDSLGLNGAQVQMALRSFEPGQWGVELQHENPDLIVLNYGTNESVYPDYIDKLYEKELTALVLRIRKLAPQSPLLIMSPMDRGVRDSLGNIVTPSVLPQIVEIQARVAAANGLAFFNTYESMGGAGTMAKWYSKTPRMVSADFMHPLPQGAAIVGRLFEDGLTKGYTQFKQNRMNERTQVAVKTAQ
ncbi:MAG TPA: GDSL-type esterase/lipase family protein [Bryobacteraceae bacterium]|nr:GDSL-type esterase/lipase family protein [Bryobacteraceae bacterium]